MDYSRTTGPCQQPVYESGKIITTYVVFPDDPDLEMTKMHYTHMNIHHIQEGVRRSAYVHANTNALHGPRAQAPGQLHTHPRRGPSPAALVPCKVFVFASLSLSLSIYVIYIYMYIYISYM
jgi:hypothetical protein